MEYRFNKKDLKFKKESFLNSQQRTRASNYKKNSEYKKTFKNKTFIPNKSNYKRWSNRELAVGSIFCLWIFFGLCFIFPWLVFLAFVPLILFLISGFLGGGDIDEPRGGHPGLFDGDE